MTFVRATVTFVFCLGFALSGCAEEEDTFQFAWQTDDKADDASGALGVADRARLDEALTAAIKGLEGEVRSLEGQIAAGERELDEKAREIDALVAQIEARKRTVTEIYNQTVSVGLLGAVLGFTGVTAASLVQTLEQDGILRNLQRDLEAAQRLRGEARERIETYRGRRERALAALARLRAEKEDLVSLVQVARPTELAAPTGVDPRAWDDAARELARVATLRHILENTERQAELLSGLLRQLQVASAQVSSALDTIRALGRAADAEAARSSELFQRLLAIALSGDPDAEAEAWLSEELARRTREALVALGWPAGEFVDAVLAGRRDAALEAALREALGAPPRPTLVLATDRATYRAGEPISARWSGGPAGSGDWLLVVRRGETPSRTTLVAFANLFFVATNLLPIPVPPTDAGERTIAPLAAGDYTLHYVVDYSYVSRGSVDFSVTP